MVAVFNSLFLAEFAEPTIRSEPYAEEKLSDRIRERNLKCNDATLALFATAVLQSFSPLYRALPFYLSSEEFLSYINTPYKETTIPLYDLLPPLAILMPEIILPFITEDVSSHNLFKGFRAQYDRNVPNAKERPKDFKGSNLQFIQKYLNGTPFSELFQVPIPFTIPQHTRFEHTHIVAGPGHGKTQTLQNLIAGDLTADHPPALVVIDSQGDLIRKIERLALFAPDAQLADRLVIIDPTDTKHPPALNLFDIDRSRFATYDEAAREQIENGTIELYDYIFGSLLGAELTQKQSVIFRYLARLMLSIPNATIHDLVRLLQDPTPYLHHVEALPAGARSFFETEFNDRKEFAATKKQILRRLWGILEQPSFERMFTQPKNRIDMFDALNTGKILLVNTAKDFLKAERSSLFGRTFIALTLQAALERAPIPEKDRRPAFLVIDEAHEYFDQNIDELLTQARKYKVGLVLAHQYLDQLTPSLRASLAATTSIKMAGGVSDKDARALAGDMRANPDFIAAQRKTEQQTTFATYVRNLTTSGAISLAVPFFTLEGMATMSDADHAELRAKNRARYTTPAASASLTTEAHRSASQTTDTTASDDDWRS